MHRLVVILAFLTLPVSLLPAQETKENADFKLAIGLYNDGMYDLAVEQLKNFIAAYPATSQGTEARYYLGLSQFHAKQYDEARATFQNFALSYPGDSKAPDAWLQAGEAFLKLGNEREAAAAFERIRVFHPRSALAADGLVKAGGVYRRLGNRASAKEMYRTVIREYPGSKQIPDARLALAEVYAEEGASSLAGQEIRRLLDGNVSSGVKAGALLVLGRIRLEEGVFDQAESTLTALVRSRPDPHTGAQASFDLGRLAAGAGNFEAAIRCFKSVIAESAAAPETLRARSMIELGTVYARSGGGNAGAIRKSACARARETFESFLNVFPDNALRSEALLLGAYTALLAGDPENALKYARMLTASSPPSPHRAEATFIAAAAAGDAGSPAEAARYYSLYLAGYPDGPYAPKALYRLADVTLHGLNNPRKARYSFEEYLERYPTSSDVPAALRGMAVCCKASGDLPGAIGAFRKLLRYEQQDSVRDGILRSIESLEDSAPNSPAAVSRLAGIVGEIARQSPAPSRAVVEYRLGRISFEDLREYAEAARHFDTAIALGLGEEFLREAQYERAAAYDRLSANDSLAAGKAMTLYREFLALHPPLAGRMADAPYRSYRLEVRALAGAGKDDAAGVRKAAETARRYLREYPAGTAGRDEILYDLGKALMIAPGGDTAAALAVFDTLIRTTRPASPDAGGGSSRWFASLLARGDLFAERGQADSAITCWQQGASFARSAEDPFLPTVLRRLAGAYRAKKRFAESIPLMERLRNEFPHAGYSWKELAESYMEAGRYDDAIAVGEEAETLLREEPDPLGMMDDGGFSQERLARMGMAYERKGNRQEALELYRLFLMHGRKNPLAGTIFYSCGRIARAGGDASLAADYFRQAAAAGGGGGTVSREIADLLFQSEQYADAARQYTQLGQEARNADSVRYCRERAIVCMLRMDKLPDAEKLISAFERSFGDAESAERAGIAYEKGLSYYRMQEYTSAKKAFEKVADDFSGTRFAPWGRYYIGKIAEVTNKPEEAAAAYRDILARSPQSDVRPHVLLSLGNMHFNAERFDEAITLYQAIVKDSGAAGDILPYAMNNLIEAFESLKLYDAALKTTRDFLARFPDDESIMEKKIKVGALYTRIGYYDQAVQQFQLLLGDAGSSMEAELHYDIGEAYFDKGDYQQAILEFLKVPYCVSRQGKVNWTATSLYMAGQAYEKLAKFDEAIGIYQQIVERTGIDQTFKAAARKEIDRVRGLTQKGIK